MKKILFICLLILFFILGMIVCIENDKSQFFGKAYNIIFGALEKNYSILDKNQAQKIFTSSYVNEYDSLLKKFNFITDLDSIEHRYDNYQIYQFWDETQKLVGICTMAQMSEQTLNVILHYFPEFNKSSEFYNNLITYQPVFIDFISVRDGSVFPIIKEVIQERAGNNYIIWLDKCNEEYKSILQDHYEIDTEFFIFFTNFNQKNTKNIDVNFSIYSIQQQEDFIHFNSDQIDDFIYSFGLKKFNDLNQMFSEFKHFITTAYYFIKRYKNFNLIILMNSEEFIGVKLYFNLKNNQGIISKKFKSYNEFNDRILRYNPIYVFTFFIKPNYRGKGYSSRIFEILNNLNKNRSMVLSVEKDNSHAINVYKHFGFEIVPVNNRDFYIMLKKSRTY